MYPLGTEHLNAKNWSFSVARTNVDDEDGTTGMPTIMLDIWTVVMNFKAL